MAGLRYALRTLRRQSGSAAVVIGTLAVAIGATTIIASMIEGILHAIPAADRSNLVFVSSTDPRPSQSQSGMYGELALTGTSVPDLVDWSARTRTIDEFIAYRYDSATLRDVGLPTRVQVVRTTANLPSLFALSPVLGRLFRAEEGRTGASHVVLLSDRFWRQHFQANPTVTATSLVLDGTPYSIVGVLSPEAGRGIFAEVDLFVSTPLDAARAARDERRLFVFGRLHPGATIETASAELSSIAADLRRIHPATNAQTGAVVRPLIEQLGGNIMAINGVMAMIAALIVAMACANVSNVMLALGAGRRRELSVRSALGAGRLDHVRGLMFEALVLALAAGVLGIMLGASGLAALKWLAGPEARLVSDATVSGRVAAVGMLGSFLLPFAFGLLPALKISRTDLSGLGDGGRTGGGEGTRLGSVLVAVQVGLAVILMVQIALTGRAVMRIVGAPLGFDPSHTLTFKVDLPEDRFGDPLRIAAFERQLLSRIDALPGVTSVAATSRLPIADREQVVRISIDGVRAALPADMPAAAIATTSLEYLSTLRMPLDSGRPFTDADFDGPPVAVVSREAVRRFWPGQDPIGRTLTVHTDPWPNTPLRVVGVVRDARPSDADRRVGPQLYVPSSWHRQRQLRFVVRAATADPLQLVAPIRRVAATLEPDQPIFDALSLEQALYNDGASAYTLALLLAVIGVIAQSVAAVGIYGLVSHRATRRTREIGVRLALGASRGTVVRLVIRQGTLPVACGGFIGLIAATALAFATAGAVSTNARDPVAYLVVTVSVGVAALLATYGPARRASRLNPVEALRMEP